MEKDNNLNWFNEIMKVKMLKHEDEKAEDMKIHELVNWLEAEVLELKIATLEESKSDIVLECADIANMAYFIANKIKNRK